MSMTTAAVLGTGAWGTTFAQVLADAGVSVTMWGRNADTISFINGGENPTYLPGIELSGRINATTDIAEAVAAVKESGAVALFAENSNNSKSIEAIARAAGVTPIVGEDAMYGDSLGPEGSEGATYVGSIVHNVRAVTQAWGGTVPDLPERLKDQ